MQDPNSMVYLLMNPHEPMILPKGQKNKNMKQFVVPFGVLNPEYNPIAMQVVSRFGEDTDEQVEVKQLDTTPDLTTFLEIPRDDSFSIFNPVHAEIAGKLVELLLAPENTDDLLPLAIYVRERVNPSLFQYALSVALMHRKDTKNVNLPAMVTTFPDRFFHSKVISKAREQAAVVPEERRTPIEIPFYNTASEEEPEHLLFYFREDIGVNLHHWSWHLVYPQYGPREVVDKDRRGELFYYMHEQMIARYNCDRFCNGLKLVEPLEDFGSPIKEAYFPKLDQKLTGRSFPGRVANLKLRNVHREGPGEHVPVDVDSLRRWRDNILAAIDAGFVRDKNNNKIPLDEKRGIDILGDMIESVPQLSVNPQLYGNLHSNGHYLVAYIHDPDGRHLEKNGVMGDLSTAVRDPTFYRWHSFINNMFVRHKNLLPRYTVDQLDYSGILVESVEVQTEKESPNVLKTFWSKATVNIANGLDFQHGGDLFIKFTILQHDEFKYNIIVNNSSGVNKLGTCRIFMSSKYDENGKPWKFSNQNIMFIELDKFKVTLKQGRNTIVRSSIDSTVTIPFKQTYRDLSTISGNSQQDTTFCGCGWPHNLLIPKGTPEGFPCELFVMISNYENDKVDQEEVDTQLSCKDAYSYCGSKDKRFPDRRSMGFPFDRMPRDGVETLQQFLTPNMKVADFKIVFTDKVILKDEE